MSNEYRKTWANETNEKSGGPHKGGSKNFSEDPEKASEGGKKGNAPRRTEADRDSDEETGAGRSAGGTQGERTGGSHGHSADRTEKR